MEELDLRSIRQARSLLEAAHEAAGTLAGLSQEAIDAIVDAIHRAALPKAETWARMAVEETGFGNVADKIRKNRFAASAIYEHIRPLRTVGILREDPERRLVEIAAPSGVIAAIIPSTNPTSTAINKILISVKAACPVVLSPHPGAKECVADVCAVLDKAARSAGAPPGTIGCLTEVHLTGTRELMKHPLTALILATGGTSLVRAAYSSGKPAYGVGPGNVPAYVDRSADPVKAANDILAGKTFDNGVLCSAENAIVAHREIDGPLRSALEAAGGRFLDEEGTETLSRFAVASSGALNTAIIGRSARAIAEMSGLAVPPGTRCLIAPLREVGPQAPLSREKLSPILAYYVEASWEDACERCLEILRYGGMGHTMAVHAADDDLVRRFALGKPVFRLVVNTPSAVGAVGFTTGLDPSMTLGCGALGGNITSDNITPLHLINVKRLAYETRPYDDAARPSEGASAVGGPARTTADPQDGKAARTLPVVCPPALPSSSQPCRRLQADPLLRERVEAALNSRLKPPEPACGKGTTPQDPPRAEEARSSLGKGPAPSPPPPVPFVCEADVRRALDEKRKIRISKATILTPSARDLGDSRRVFDLV